MFASPLATKLPIIAFALGLNALLWVAMFWRRA
jgi:hypothetical protein